MFLRKFRWIIASVAVVAAVVGSPAQSKADVQILIEEIGVGGVSPQYTTLLGSGVASFSGTFFSGLVTVSSNSASASPTASLTPSFSGQLTSAFTGTQQLRITVTDDKFIPNGPTGSLRVETSGSTGFATGMESVSSTTRIYDPSLGTTIPASSTTQTANGSTIAGPVELATPDGTKVTGQIGVSGLTSPFAIQQTILVSFSGDIPANATFGATGGASVTSNAPPAAVPAPAGLVLGLIALPLLGLRRTLRKRDA